MQTIPRPGDGAQRLNPVARQQGQLSRIFRGELYRKFATDSTRSTPAEIKDDLLIYCKRVRHRLDSYLVNVPPQERARAAGNPPFARRERCLTGQLQPIADAILQPIGDSFRALMTSHGGLF
ncbi:hypothetical protein [Variovorax paradoxus]|uniref:hypothetical protein n=1 Tax=Variovorax paradoxus TaxID=34073 RepID=UPI003D6522D5